MAGNLQVVVADLAAAQEAEAAGADRIELVGSFDEDWFSPTPELVDQVCRKITIPVRPLLRLRAGFRTDGGEFSRLRGLAWSYLESGAEGLVAGFLDGYSGIDMEVMSTLVNELSCPWGFDQAFDLCLDPQNEWVRVTSLANLDQIQSAGSPLGIEHGLDTLIQQAKTDPLASQLLVASGGLQPEHVPWLARAGITTFQLDNQTYVTNSAGDKTFDPKILASWRSLIDDTFAHLHKSNQYS